MQPDKRRLRFLLFSATIVALSVASLSAQTFGSVTGHITDASGAAVPGAKVTLTNVATNALRITNSTDSGDYTFPDVQPGVYNIRLEQSAFKSAGSTNIQV